MSAVDAAWLHMGRPTNLMIVNGLLQLDAPIDYALAKETIRERLVERFPRFHQRVGEPPLGLGLPAWEDDPEFDLDLHIHRRALPAPGDAAALRELASELVVVPLDPAKPLWDMYVIEGYGSGAAVLARMHHCIADGVALARVLLSLTDGEPATDAVAVAEAGGPRSRTASAAAVVHLLDGALHEGIEVLTHPTSETRALADAMASNTRALAKLLLTGRDTRTVLKQPLGVARRLDWCEPVPLQEIKAIGHANGATVNDVVLTAMAGALRSYLDHHGSPAEEVRAVIPFNLRPLDQPLPVELGNRFGLVEVSLPLALADARERLAEVHRRMHEIKRSPEGPLSHQLLGLIGRTPPLVERRLLDVMSDVESLVITNVPGPSQPVYFAGAKVTDVLAWVPTGGGISIGVSVISYDGAVTVALQTAANVVPDPERLISAFADEMRGLKQLRSRSRRRSRPQAPSRR